VCEGGDKFLQNFSHKTREGHDLEYSIAAEEGNTGLLLEVMEFEVMQWIFLAQDTFGDEKL
jgi:hypothetical protein